MPKTLRQVMFSEYNAWRQMKSRCSNPGHQSYPHYGARGITVCAAWQHSFEAFVRDVGPRPSSKHSLHRINNDDGYHPGNVRWATGREQNNNTRRNNVVVFGGESMTVTQWRRVTRTKHATVYWRMNHGWTVLQALGLETRKSKDDEVTR